MTVYVILCVLLAVLQVTDAATTLTILKQGGRELNPVMRRLFDIFKTPTRAFIVKGIVVVLAGAFIGASSVDPLAILVGVYLLVTIWNLYQIKRS